MLNKLAFRLNFSEIEERLDPIFYYKRSNLDLVNKTSLPVYKLKDVINMQRGRFGHRPRNDPSFYDGDYPFIQTGDVVRANFSSNISYSQTLNDKGLKTSRLFSEPVVVLTIAANIGYTAILNYPACFPDSLIGLTSKNDLLELEYINIYISLIRQYIEDLAPQAAQKNINYQQLASIPIVVPAKDIQSKIIDLWNTAQGLEKIKRQQAKEKLTSIDKYLLEKLGVVGLNERVSTLKDRIFKMNKSKLQSNRWDVSYYADNYFDSLEKSKFPIVKLKNIILENPIYGASAEAVDFDSNNSVRYLRITDIDELGQLKNSNPKSVKDYSDRHKVFYNDIFFARSGSVGKCYIHKLNNTKFIFAGYLIKFKIDPNICLPDYLFYYAYSSIYLKWVEKIQRPGVQANINATEYKDLPIILPSIDFQKDIVDYISKVRDEAKMLEEEANLILENAKQEIEKMILGETE